jgi:DNA-binding CsgD family transcriptional regulator
LPYFLRGFLAVLQSDPTAARPALARAVIVARDAGQLRLLAESLAIGSVAANMAGDRTSARRLLDESQVVAEGIDDVSAMLAFLQARALNGFFEGDLDTVRASSSEGVRLSRETGDTYGLEMLLINLGSAALLACELDQAQPLFAEALRISNEIDDRVAQYILLDLLGCHAASSGRARRAAQLLGAAEAVRTGVGATLIPTVAPLVAGAEASAIAALGASSFEAEFNAGKRLSRDAAIGTALGEPAHVVAATPDDASVAPLAKREADVARLVAEGLSNKQIGARLFISERTVDSHVRSILNKLGFNSRAQIAGWMASSNQ